MQKFQRLLMALIVAILIINNLSANANEKQEQRIRFVNPANRATDPKLYKSNDDLINVIRDHEKWLDTEGKKGLRANLSGAILYRANLSGANLKDANLSNISLTKANLAGANLSGAILDGASLINAILKKADLRYASLRKANLVGSDLIEANLCEATLYGTKLSATNLSGANMDNAFIDENTEIKDADLTGSSLFNVELSIIVFEPKQGSRTYIPSIASYYGLSLMTFNYSSLGLVDLRDGFREARLRKQEREITYAIKHRERLKLFEEKNIFKKIESLFHLIMFEAPCKYGMAPGRPIWLLGIFMLFFSIPYTIGLKRPGKDGIWQEWLPNRIREDLGAEKPILLNLTGFAVLKTGIYFSVLSAFSIGWREINVGNWIARIQRREYTLRPSGWVRTTSGIQSLISVYLVALWILTYFGRPFD